MTATATPGSETPAVASSSDTNAHATTVNAPAPSVPNTRSPGGIQPSSTDGPNVNEASLEPGQLEQSLSTVRVPDLNSVRSHRIEEARVPSRRSWLVLAFAEHSAAAFDAYSTRLAVSRGAVEQDPLMRPFAHSDAIYAASQVGPLLFDYVARRMQRSDNLTLRRFWWLPQSVSTGVSLFAGVHNIHVANSLTK
ncbi:MAG TPA: hypothetical protein VMU43_00820 [Candidatus Acidoferrum sp.]|nr:hypothetical protein [Candidatus Acidoferrum sp.]